MPLRDRMTAGSDIVAELHTSANSIFDVDPLDRQRLIVFGLEEAASLEKRLQQAGHAVGDRPGFMDDMPELAKMAARPEAVEVLIAAGMSMLAAEIDRLRELAERLTDPQEKARATFAEALVDSGFEPFNGARIVVKERRNRERLRRPGDDAT
ncbi:hypothetical protein [Neorhizobium tomejilense]|uniref:hypothetical protein n=1 Tax=Neorhizobium tomejilense TaxID=2093828 RepID=UPI00155E2B6B|nr:hypothetical protein [Neorhizobium tomejilense]